MSALRADPPPSSILIVGAGVFGLSTLLTLLTSRRYASTHLTIIDTLPVPSFQSETSAPIGTEKNIPTASLDSSRIIRADYASPAYASLAAKAQQRWREGWGGVKKGRYTECGLVLTAYEDGGTGEKYVEDSLGNVRRLDGEKEGAGNGRHGEDGNRKQGIQELKDKQAIKEVMRGTGGSSGDKGYVNWGSGWVDAEGAIQDVKALTMSIGTRRGNFSWKTGQVTRLIFSPPTSASDTEPPAHNSINNKTSKPAKAKVAGVHLLSQPPLLADLTILATGAWTNSLIDLRGRVEATGQALAYMQLSSAQAERLKDMPILLNMSTGMFIIPPTAEGVLKVARHGFGYRNLVEVRHPEVPLLGGGEGDEEEEAAAQHREDSSSSSQAHNPTPASKTSISISISLPAPDFTSLPPEAHHACLTFLQTMIPWLSPPPPSSNPPHSNPLPSNPHLPNPNPNPSPSPFTSTRLCWYTDTPTGDFLITYHPSYSGLFLATGGSGHGYKFLPVLGEEVVGVLEGGGKEDEDELGELWGWRARPRLMGEEEKGFVGTEDGSRGGRRGMSWGEEMAKGGY
ncbi:hypothetical protein MMC24_001072 [Lignoscripta atroalba]|nr:hypothetical protein [Lignoscripta atroalba]